MRWFVRLVRYLSISAALTVAAAVTAHVVSIVPAAATTQPPAVVVIKQYGAALRVAPSSEAEIVVTASCGETLSVVGSQDGWYEVYSRAQYLWVGGARVADAARPPQFSCREAVTFQVFDTVETFVVTGCLSLRAYASRNAPFEHCVTNGHRYTILNGPIEVAGEDWFEVWSGETGSGWVLAQFIFPMP
jgi:hypothetical protein